MHALRRIAVVGASLATVVGVGLGTTNTALADPSSTPSLTTLVGVGSDTITPLFAGSPTENTAGSIVTDYNDQTPAPTYPLASWDAVDPPQSSSPGATGGTITAKAANDSDTSCVIFRPDGASVGIAALNENQDDSTKVDIDGAEESAPCIDYVQSDRPEDTSTFDR